MVLLGNPDYDNRFDFPPSFMWRLHGADGSLKDYEEFRVPYIIVVDKIYEKVRNLTYRYMPNQMTLFPIETQQYDSGLLRELLNNCIAHQDYTIGGRVYVDEYDDTVVITNPGTFLPGDVREVLKPGYTAPYYRNQLLAEVMTKVNMIDTAQWGIRKVFNIQRNRYFPMPDYDFIKPNQVAVRVYGKILDGNYTRLLFGHDDLSIETVFLLDRIQKRLPIEKEQYQRLRKMGLIEGKLPNVYISAKVAEIVDAKVQYTRNKALDDQYYVDLMISHLRNFGKATKADFLKLLEDKLSDALSDEQKSNKVRHFLTTLRKNGVIEHTDGNRRTGEWKLTEQQSD
jgi:ATP-dependent DNA helicase RecG